MKRQSQFGFAFIEVAMVTVMIMLISSFTVPQLAASMELYRLDIAASMIQGKLVEAAAQCDQAKPAGAAIV